MIEIQLSQMSAAKLTTQFIVQAYYLGATTIDYGNQIFSVLKSIGDWKRVAYITSIGWIE